MDAYLSTAWQNIQVGWWVAVIWAVGYNGTGQLTRGRAMLLPHNWLTAVDKKIPYFPHGFDLIYFLGYPLAFYPLFVVTVQAQVWVVLFAYALTLMTSFLIFVLWPVKMDRPEPRTFLSLLIQKYDSPSNCIPSLHCSYATLPLLAALLAGRPEWPIVGLVGLGVVISTVFIKQHYAIDCILGIAVAVLSFGFMYGLFYLV